jgi:hypothetical protein
MDPDNPTVPNSLFDLEIKCEDNVSIYVSRSSLAFISDYFKLLLLGNFKEGSSNIITLSHKSTILIILFKCVFYGFKGIEYCKKILNEINNEDIWKFFSACDEYQLKSIIMLAEDFFSSDEKIIICFNAEMINLIHLLNLKKIADKIHKLIDNETIKITDLNFELINCVTLNFLNHWKWFLQAFNLWLDKNETNDEELEKCKIFDDNDNYNRISNNSIFLLKEIMDTKMKLYPITTSKIIHSIFNANFNTKIKSLLSNKPNDGNVDYFMNHTKKNYVKLNGVNSEESHMYLFNYLCGKGVWDYKDNVCLITHSHLKRPYSVQEYDSLILEYINSI